MSYRLPHSVGSLGIGNPRVTFYIETPNGVAYSVVDYGWQLRVSGPDGTYNLVASFLRNRNGDDRKPSYASAKRIAIKLLRDEGIVR